MPGNTQEKKTGFSIRMSPEKKKDKNNWLLTQAAMIEMYARIAELK
jgi:hypothetical protein